MKGKNEFSLVNKKIWVPGSNGMVGNAVVKKLHSRNLNVVTTENPRLNLINQNDVNGWVKRNKPDVIFLCAAKVGGIHANRSYPVEFIYENLMIQSNVIHSAFLNNIKKIVFLGSSCVYPAQAKQPIKESYLLQGKPEVTNQHYALAKIAGIKLIQAYCIQYKSKFISIMPTNLYGPNDNFHPVNSHVPAALIDKMHNAKINKLKEVEVWGTGTPKREFMHVDDLADAVIFLSENYNDQEIINVGTGKDITIKEFAKLIKQIVGFKGDLVFDSSKPDGMKRKLLDTSKLTKLGWKPRINLENGIKSYYKWYKNNLLRNSSDNDIIRLASGQ